MNDLLRELERLTDGNKLGRPKVSRNRSGQYHRDTGGEWDWFYSLPESERTWIQRNHMVDNGLGPDELATWLGCSVDEALTQWLAAVQASRKPADEWDEIEPSDERNVDEALEMVRLATNMDEDQWREIEDMVRARIAGEGATIAGESMEPDEPWTMPRTGKFLTQHDIARVLGLPAVNVRVWNNRGKLPKPSGYVGKRPMWLRSEIRQWCEELNELRCGVGSS